MAAEGGAGGGASVDAARRANWHGAIPVIVSMAKGDVAVAEHERLGPVHMMVARRSYLSVSANDLLTAFQAALPPLVKSTKHMWMEYQGVPLQWHLPAGVLYDMHVLSPQHGASAKRAHRVRQRSGVRSAAGNAETPVSSGAGGGAGAGAGAGAGGGHGETEVAGDGSGTVLPWRITVHFQGCPESVLRLGESAARTQQQFMNALKHACLLRTGSGSSVMTLAKDKQLALYRCMLSGDYDGFDAVNRELAGGAGPLPVRWCVAGFPPRQRSMPRRQADGSATTVAQALRAVYVGTDFTFADEEDDGGKEDDDASLTTVTVSGVAVPSGAPLEAVVASLSHPDNWCYCVVHRSSSPPVVHFVMPPQ